MATDLGGLWTQLMTGASWSEMSRRSSWTGASHE